LKPEELDWQLRVSSDKYYAWLVAALVENSFDKSFIRRQRAGMRAIGFELSAARVLRAAAMRGVEFAQQPGVSMSKISTMLNRKGRIEARAYRDNGV